MQTQKPQRTDFFSYIACRRRDALVQPECSVEVDNYLADASVELPSINSYPRIRYLYLQFNIELPSSTAVERLFSLGGCVFSPLRSRLRSDHFEMIVFLFLRSSK